MKFEPFFSSKKALDKSFIFYRDSEQRKEFRNHIESLWKKYHPYADENFLIEASNHFHQRSWEMFLACSFLEQGFKLIHQPTKGPDIKFELKDSIAWCETTTATRGDNAVDKMHWGTSEKMVVMDVPEEHMITRLTSAINDKYKIFKEKYLGAIVKEDEPFIIALNRYEVEYMDSDIPLILSAVFGVGHLMINLKTGDSKYGSRPTVKKKNKTNVETTYFCNDRFKEISAIIYSTDSVINLIDKYNGAEISIVHNPFAKNKLPRGLFKFDREYVADGDKIVDIRRAQISSSSRYPATLK